jgi:hypothetical protein
MITCPTIADKDFNTTWGKSPLDYSAVDAQYFACALIPQKANPNDVWFAEIRPRAVGAIPTDKNNLKLTNVSFTCTSTSSWPRRAAGTPLSDFAIQETDAAGPIRHPGTVTLSDLVYYGWSAGRCRCSSVARLSCRGQQLAWRSLLTVLARVHVPLSRKQAISSQKMQLLQPEMKYQRSTRTARQEDAGSAACPSNFNRWAVALGVRAAADLRGSVPFAIGRRAAAGILLARASAGPRTSRADMFWDWSSWCPTSSVTARLSGWVRSEYSAAEHDRLFIWQQRCSCRRWPTSKPHCNRR